MNLDDITASERSLAFLTEEQRRLEDRQLQIARGITPPQEEFIPSSTMSDDELIAMKTAADAENRAISAEIHASVGRYGGAVGLGRRLGDGFRRWRYRAP
jgi:hypothetical protein